MNWKHSWFLFFNLIFLMLMPIRVIAVTSISNKVISKDAVWTAAQSPYVISGTSEVSPGITLTLQPGTQVVLDHTVFDVRGTVVANGTDALPVSIKEDAYSSGFKLQGGILDFKHADISGGRKFIDAFASSTVFLDSSSVHDLSADAVVDSAAISVWNNGSIYVTNTNFTNIQSKYGIEAFNRGSISTTNSTFNSVGSYASLTFFDSTSAFTVGDIESTSFSNAHIGIEAYNRTLIDSKDSEFSHMSEAGMLIYNNANAIFTNASFSDNQIGIEAYNASTSISLSSLERNSEYGAYVFGGTFTAINDWWGDESGPYHLSKNPNGKGDAVDGSDDISPWLTEKNKKATPCCSNVLFIPGLEGSRMYKRQSLGENQLWEPNRNADVKKLFLDVNGNPVDSTLYNRDVILRTNFGLGFLDRDIYKGFIDSLDKRVRDHSMKEWQAFPYDWRKSPDDIVTNGTQVGSSPSLGTWKKQTLRLEDMVTSLAKSSMNKKVTIVAHSYGGLVAKKLAEDLERKGMSSLVDKIILVGVPEDGTVESVAAILHGDDQELGKGFILKADTARTLSLNMPAAYYLLPDSSLTSWLSSALVLPAQQSTPSLISVNSPHWFGSASSVGNTSALDEFMKDTNNQHPHSKSESDIVFPAKANASLLDSARVAAKTIQGTNAQSAVPNISFVNIIGTGIKTLKSISYVDAECPSLYNTASVYNSIYCNLDHKPFFTDSGDGAVPIGNLDDRWGTKLIFDMGEYDRKEEKNYSHTDMLSSKPLIDILNALLDGGDPTLTFSNYINPVSPASSPQPLPIVNHSAYQFSVTGNAVLSATDENNMITGEFAQILNGDAFPVYSQIPLSVYGHTGGSEYVVSEKVPQKISVQSTGIGSVTITAEKINAAVVTQDSSGVLSGYTASDNTPLFVFKNIPVIGGTAIVIDAMATDASFATVHIDRDGDGVFETIETSMPAISTVIASSTPSSSVPISGTASSTSTTTTGTLLTLQTLAEALQKLRGIISSSTVTVRFKQRYMNKTNVIDRDVKKNQTMPAVSYTQNTVQSLAAIVKELSRSVDRYYKGGMTKPEAVFMYFSWSDFLGVARAILSPR